MRSMATWPSFLFLALISGPTLAEPWIIDYGTSRLAFVATWEDTEFDGVFNRFEGNMLFDASQPAASAFDVTVDVTSADSNSADRDAAMADPEWFHFRRYPEARFVTSTIKARGNDHYEAQGTLTIKGASRPVVLPFTWREAHNQAKMIGEALLRRTEFGIGEGEWEDGDVIGLDVRVIVDLSLVRGSASTGE